MATRSVLGYMRNPGEVRGTYVHWDGYPEGAIPSIEEMFAEMGFDGVKQWIEDGIAGGGYSSYGDEAPYDEKPWNPKFSHNSRLDDEEYGYLVSEDGVELVYPIPRDRF